MSSLEIAVFAVLNLALLLKIKVKRDNLSLSFHLYIDIITQYDTTLTHTVYEDI